MESSKLNPAVALDFILGGNSRFTIRRIATGGRFTYRVSKPYDKKPEESSIWFVSLLSGSDNENDYSYFGYIRKVSDKFQFFFGGAKSRIGNQAPGVVVFDKVFNTMLTHGLLSTQLEIWHEGKCCRCGRTLTVPESIESGIGPECSKISSNYKTHKHEKVLS